MTKALILDEIFIPDDIALAISEQYVEWDNLRRSKLEDWKEIQQYIFATDTSKTGNSILPWSNKTTLPKLCQIRDNLFANYIKSMFPTRKWNKWEGSTEGDESIDKKIAIESYMDWATDRSIFYKEMENCVYDYIDYGNVFGTVDWTDGRSTDGSEAGSAGYVGPVVKRISPVDIVFNIASTSFEDSPKIIRSLISIGEVKKLLEKLSISEDEREYYTTLYDKMQDNRAMMREHEGSTDFKNSIYEVAGFTSYSQYLTSDTVEVLTYYGDFYDVASKTLHSNQVIRVVDRMFLVSQNNIDTLTGKAPIFHVGWRKRPDTLVAMGPLDNLVGMQYRIDHLENLKADIFDIVTFPVIKIKGDVPDFEWKPFERIYLGDTGEVELLSPDSSNLSSDNQIAIYESKMEEMAGSPKEAAGFRTPGEKTAYEFRRLENAASRIFNNKIEQFEREVTEHLLNAMLELARKRMDETTIRVFDDEIKLATFSTLTSQDLTGNGRLRPVAARNFAEKEIRIQTLNAFLSSSAGQDPQVLQHFSSLKLAKLWEELLDIGDENIVAPYIRISEQADSQRLINSAEQQLATEVNTPSGLLDGDFDEEE